MTVPVNKRVEIIEEQMLNLKGSDDEANASSTSSSDEELFSTAEEIQRIKSLRKNERALRAKVLHRRSRTIHNDRKSSQIDLRKSIRKS